jgi:hypothetical protein
MCLARVSAAGAEILPGLWQATGATGCLPWLLYRHKYPLVSSVAKALSQEALPGDHEPEVRKASTMCVGTNWAQLLQTCNQSSAGTLAATNHPF